MTWDCLTRIPNSTPLATALDQRDAQRSVDQDGTPQNGPGLLMDGVEADDVEATSQAGVRLGPPGPRRLSGDDPCTSRVGDNPLPPIVDKGDGWAKELVVARCHRMAICARHGYRQFIADTRVLRKLSVGHQDVAGLTVHADSFRGKRTTG